MKNRNRSKYSFANINLLGPCNFDCRWCLGKDLAEEFGRYNYLDIDHGRWPRFEEFLTLCKFTGVKQLYITGQNTDSLMYCHLGPLMDYLHSRGFYVGLRTNGFRATAMIATVNLADCEHKGSDAVSFTMVSNDKATHRAIVGHGNIPQWDKIIPAVAVPFRFATVIDRHNAAEFLELVREVKRLTAGNRHFQYFQVRRVSTDHRADELAEDMRCWDRLHEWVRGEADYLEISRHETAVTYDVLGVPCSFWSTVATTANSLNYFVNGVISDEYFIIEGYEKNRKSEVTDE